MALERKLKTALDESRLLILGAEVLFGFQFQGVFQELFSDLPFAVRLVQGAGAILLLLAIGLLIAPSMHHRIVFGGEARVGALRAATMFAGASLLPLTLGLGTSVFVVFTHLFDAAVGTATAALFVLVGLGLLYGLGFVLNPKRGGKMEQEPRETSLETKIEQLLTEARVIIPGGQALLGFQFVATLTKSFAALPHAAQLVHVAALCAVALAVLLLMTPAALHRLAYGGEDDPQFFRIGSRLVTAAALPLALGICADLGVVLEKITENVVVAASGATVALAALIGLWFIYPLWMRQARGGTLARRHPSG